jgi:flagellar basal-body rod protein FlgG
VTKDGDMLIPNLTIPSNATSVTISKYGVVTAAIPGQTIGAQLGTIQLATFANPGGLNTIGGNLFLQTASSGNAITDNPGAIPVWERCSRAISRARMSMSWRSLCR